MEEISEEDGGNISRRWRKYLEKMEEISREDGGNISRRWRKEQVDECGELPSMHCAQFWSPTTTFVAKIAKSRNLYCFANGTHCGPNLDGTWLQIRYHARFFPLRL